MFRSPCTAKIPVWFAVIDKSVSAYPLYVREMSVNAKVLWNYYMHDDQSIKRAVKGVLGIQVDAPVVFDTFCEYLINPATGEISYGESDETLEEFMQKVYARQFQLATEEPMPFVPVI